MQREIRWALFYLLSLSYFSMQALARNCPYCSCAIRQSKGWCGDATIDRGEHTASALLVWGLSAMYELSAWHYREVLKAFGLLGLFQFLLYRISFPLASSSSLLHTSPPNYK